MKRFTKIIFPAVVFGLVALLSTSSVQAQDISANANVLKSLSYSTVSPLDFGDVVQGTSPSVSKGSGGQLSISGSSGESVDVTFSSVPDSLFTNTSDGTADGTNDGGFDGLRITFGSNAAGLDNNEDGTYETTFNVSTSSTGSVTLDGGDTNLDIGGTVSATSNQPSGSYTNTITVSASYSNI